MEHPDNGQIQALLDGELVNGDAEKLRAHLATCAECDADGQGLEAVASDTARALSLLDTEPALDEARARFLARNGGFSKKRGSRQAGGPRRFLGFSWSLPKAASIVLLLTGATVTALPGSPVRRWMTHGWHALVDPAGTTTLPGSPEGTPETPGLLSPEQGAPETGAGVSALANGLEIWIHDLPAAAGLRVLWTDGEEAWVYAGEGTRFNSVDGRLEAFAPPGGVRVEIPRSLQSVVLGLDGEVLLRKSGGELEILAPVRERSPSEIRFEVPGSTNDGRP